MAEEEYVRVRFRVAVNTELGDTVHILGDQELGCWDKNKSVVLVTTPASYPIWQTSRPLRLQKVFVYDTDMPFTMLVNFKIGQIIRLKTVDIII